jgi:hypothetical protein
MLFRLPLHLTLRQMLWLNPCCHFLDGLLLEVQTLRGLRPKDFATFAYTSLATFLNTSRLCVGLWLVVRHWPEAEQRLGGGHFELSTALRLAMA